MRARKTPRNEDKKVVKVYCGECRWFARDTEGRSRRQDTGEYFMGTCIRGLHPDSPIKQFADKKRTCDTFKKLNG